MTRPDLYPEHILMRFPAGTKLRVDALRGHEGAAVYLRRLVLDALAAADGQQPPAEPAVRQHHDLVIRRLRSLQRRTKFGDETDPALPGLQAALAEVEAITPQG